MIEGKFSTKDQIRRLLLIQPDLRGLLLVLLVSCWLVGILVNAWLLLPSFVLLVMGMLALILIGFCWQQPALRLSGLVLLCCCLGAWRYTTVSSNDDAHTVRAFLYSSALQIEGTVADDPRLESQSTLLTVNAQLVSLDRGQSWQEVHGEMQVQIPGATFDDPYAPRYGDMLQLEGRLTPPPDYATPELQASMAFPILSIKSRGGNPLLAFFYQVRTKLAAILLQALPQPYAALLIAIFLSLRLPALKPILPFFNVTGVAHLLAPSGFKVTLFAGFIGSSTRWLLPGFGSQSHKLLPAERRRGEWRRWLHTLLLILCIVLYTMLSGSGPAALRAGGMGVLLVLAPRLKRFYNVYTAMALIALLMSLVDPFLLWDTGFQLSFVGTLGILLFTAFFQRHLRFLARLPLGAHMAELLAVTLAAQTATLPIFALSFNTISFVSPLTNLATVPLLGLLLVLGTLICLCGLLAPPLAVIIGWLAWPLLWYTTAVAAWCAGLPGAYLLVDKLSPLAAWIYYALLASLIVFLFTHRQPDNHQRIQHSPALLRSTKLALQCVLALCTLLSIALLSQAAPSDARLALILLSSGDPAQGQALFLRTPDGQTALIDEGASSATLAQTLDTRLPFWQRSLSLVILSDTSAANLAGLQDVIIRYHVQRVVDAGMLHPTLAYARWRSTLDTRNLSYTQVRQGTLIALGRDVTFQVLWPPASLHKSSDETHDNALSLRLLAPGLRMLLLNSTALSNYALQMLTLVLTPSASQAEIVQLGGETGKAFPATLSTLLAQVHPSLLLLTTTPARRSKSTVQTGIATTPSLPAGPWKALSAAQSHTLEIQSDEHGWGIQLSG